ncbi:LOW QUALITY PROTEIN: hypothetical protein Cgig2_001196 [Carnegiea gigantea]|uniref:Receptor ligand binding region domain-containing protein n=1 Tax=Carnegiea gigantea TaxID=171969 RepID=A0A9Q1JZJ7_9CARY|nr:LOW QUALITY PROTEIN: hypothetical protein Cgig2_001196 [Carnegiea gigantea]
MQELAKVKMMESGVLLVHTIVTDGLIILKVAEQLSMMNVEDVWIATAWLPIILDSQPNPHIFKNSHGVLKLRYHTPDSQRKRAFIAWWNQLSEGSIRLNAYGLYTYALIILETNTTCLTGPISFDSNRSLPNPSYDIINIVGSQLRQIGYYRPSQIILAYLLWHLRFSTPDTKLFKCLSEAIQPSMAWRSQAEASWMGFPRGWKEIMGWSSLEALRILFIGIIRFLKSMWVLHRRFLAAIKSLPYDVPCEFILFGDGHQNPNYIELVSRIAEEEFDAAVGDIAILAQRTKIVPYQHSGLVVVVPVRKLSHSPWTSLRTFTTDMWVGTVGFLNCETVVWILEKRVNTAFRGEPKRLLITLLWFSFSTLLFKHSKLISNGTSLGLLFELLLFELLGEKVMSSLGRLILKRSAVGELLLLFMNGHMWTCFSLSTAKFACAGNEFTRSERGFVSFTIDN